MIMMTMLITSIMFMFMNHPLSFGLILLMQTTFTALVTGTMNFNYWFSYILFLIMIGGMLVLFIYMTSIASNEKFKFSFKLFVSWSFLTFSSLIVLMIDSMFLSTKSFNNSMINQPIIVNEMLSMNKYFNYPNNLNMTIIILYLLITLIAVVKITDSQYGPLQQKF
uniref:NADH-ubiquinone oxidoreductase chain 6 n=1 Tax=Cyllorhynchites ursulus TaxID=1515519 RepID=A0A4D6SW19_9CUCU|nr:NADH dehydrogenase subunit 6 [Cyllorhynchites ursulus]